MAGESSWNTEMISTANATSSTAVPQIDHNGSRSRRRMSASARKSRAVSVTSGKRLSTSFLRMAPRIDQFIA